MSEQQQPMYAYSVGAAAAAVGAASSSLSPQLQAQQQGQQQEANHVPFQQQQQSSSSSSSSQATGGQQHVSINNVNYSNSANTSGSNTQSFQQGTVLPNFGGAGAGGAGIQQNAGGSQNNNQESVRQLQQNLLLMLQQQSEENAAAATKIKNVGGPSPLLPPQQKQQEGKASSGAGNTSGNLMAQYQQLFGMQTGDSSSGAGAAANNNNSNNRVDGSISPSSSRLFALGGMVQPLPPTKPEQQRSSKIGKGGGKQQDIISAFTLGMSESSSDFMMKLFQNDGNSGSDQMQQPEYNGAFPFQQQLPPQPTTAPSNQGTTIGGSATAALQQFQTDQQQQQQQPDLLQQQQNQIQSFVGGFSSQQQQQQLSPQDLQEQLRQKQEQLKLLQSQQQQQYLQQQQDLEPLQPSAQDDGFCLPCTMLPPSVLASMFSVETNPSKPKTVPVKAGKSHIKARKRRYNVSLLGDEASDMKPQDVLGELLDRRGYDKDCRFKADDSGYDAVPSPLQLASFGTQLVKAVQKSDITMLSKLLECGLSPNPCNQFRDSVFFDLVIKRSNLPVFECFLNHGCDLQVVDGFGRTPLHHSCWASTFCRPIVEIILQRDPVQIFLEDKHGQTPLEYVRANLYGEWNDFLEEVADKYWHMGGQPPRIISPKERRPDGHLPDPSSALSVTLASMVSSGSLSPEQVASMDENTRKSYEN